VQDALRLWERRITVQSVTVAPDPDDSQRAVVTIEYRLVATQADERTTLTLDLGA